MNVLNLNNISKTYPISKRGGVQKVLDNLSLEIKDKEIIGLLGSNGAGKSTLLKVISGLIKVDKEKNFLSYQVNYLPEKLRFYKSLKVSECTSLILNKKSKLVSEVLENFSIPQNKRISELSKGMMQKLVFLIVVFGKNKLILLDEPFSGVDKVSIEKMKEIILKQRNEGKSFLISSHLSEHIKEISDKVYTIKNGKINKYE